MSNPNIKTITVKMFFDSWIAKYDPSTGSIRHGPWATKMLRAILMEILLS